MRKRTLYEFELTEAQTQFLKPLLSKMIANYDARRMLLFRAYYRPDKTVVMKGSWVDVQSGSEIRGALNRAGFNDADAVRM